MYVIKRSGDGKMVAKAGRESSYTTSLQCAQIFYTRQDAEYNRCVDNEYVKEINLQIQG